MHITIYQYDNNDNNNNHNNQFEYLKESWSLEDTYCHSDSSERPLVNAGVENSQGVK